MQVEQLLSQKIENCIAFLSLIPSISANKDAMNKLPTFQDTKWCQWYCKQIQPLFRKDPESIMQQLCSKCCMKSSLFTVEERQRFIQYIDCFVSIVEKYC